MEQQLNDEELAGGGSAAPRAEVIADTDTASTTQSANTDPAPGNDAGASAEDPAPEAPAYPTLYERIAQLEHQVSVLTANLESALGRAEHLVETQFTSLHAEGQSWFTHLRTLIDAGIHRVEDFFGTLVHPKVTQENATDAAGTDQPTG